MPARLAKLRTAWIVLSYAGLLAAAFVSNLSRGLWEDGYFVIRFARNFWHHGCFAWNESDGPVYGMTSQTLQLLGTALYALDASHVVILLHAALTAAALATLFTIGWTLKRHGAFPIGLIPAALALSLPLLLELLTSGLETTLALWVVALTIVVTLELVDGHCRPTHAALASLLVYWTRPDAILVPLVALGFLGLRHKRRILTTYALIGLGLTASWTLFYFYYGTALPLPFYIKTHGISAQTASHLAIFAPEKTKNALQAGFLTLPFFYVALHARSRRTLALLASGLALAGYHYVATIETMGHHSRFYLPALVPIWIAAALAYPAYLARRWLPATIAALFGYALAAYVLTKLDAAHRIDLMLDHTRYLPYLAGCACMLLAPRAKTWIAAALVGASFWAAAIFDYEFHGLRIEPDREILLHQIAPRRVFRGLARLRARVPVHVLFHTDMGAPGVLFPDARVVDLDGLLNAEITLHGARFEDLCTRDRPEAIFLPNETYRELRHTVLTSRCFQNYRTVDDDPSSPLRVRADLRAQYVRD